MGPSRGTRVRPEGRRGSPRGSRASSILENPAVAARPRSPRTPIEQPAQKLLAAAVYSCLLALVLGGLPLGAGLPRFGAALALVASLNYLFGRYLTHAEPGFLASLRRQVGFYALLLGLVGLGRVLAHAAAIGGAPDWLPVLCPLSVVTLVGRLVHGQRFALELSFYAALLLAVGFLVAGYPPTNVVEVVAVLFSGSMVAVVLATRIRKRSKLVKVGLAIGFVHAITWGALQILVGTFDPVSVGFVFVHGLAVGYLVTGSLPAIEVLFEVLTDIRLLELCNENDQPLLQKLLLLAPGTYHHSFIVGVLAEAAAESVGANPLLCRAGAYYHDIGKMVKPEYFAENLGRGGGSPHDQLEPSMSFLVICAHVKDGLEIGRQYGLHPALLEFIPTHHGTSLVQYFYHRATSRAEHEQIPETSFRYAGPRPKTKETGIVSLADAVEAATRSLDHPSPARIRNRVHEIIMRRMMDRQLDETPLTFADLSRIEDAFVRVLVGIFHVRPEYPQITVRG
jgi:putative nucleotidyltransferase with HDIG domain